MFLVNYFTVTLLTLVIKIVCLLVTIAYYTLAERKIMASVQRRLGPNVVGFWGLLQPVSDGLKLFGKELVIPTHANSRIFIFAPIGVLLCAFLGWSVIPFCLFDHSSGMSTAAVRECLVSTTLCGLSISLKPLKSYPWQNGGSIESHEGWLRTVTGSSNWRWQRNCFSLTFIAVPYLLWPLRLYEYLNCVGGRC